MIKDDARELFIYQPPGGLAWKHTELTNAFLALLDELYRLIPEPSAERTLAIRALHVAKMQASAAVAIHEHPREQ